MNAEVQVLVFIFCFALMCLLTAWETTHTQTPIFTATGACWDLPDGFYPGSHFSCIIETCSFLVLHLHLKTPIGLCFGLQRIQLKFLITG